MAIQADGAQLTAHASANTLASTYSDVIATSTVTGKMARIILRPSTSGVRDFHVEIATGASSSETNILTQLVASGDVAKHYTAYEYWFPLNNIAIGTRYSARCQSSTGSSTILIHMSIMDYAWMTGNVHVFGAVAANSSGTQVDPNPSTYVEFEDSTPADIKWLMLAAQTKLNVAMTTGTLRFVIATDDSPETIIVPEASNYLFANSASDTIAPGVVGPFPVDVPSGSRLLVKGLTDIADATDQLLDVTLYGITGIPAAGGTGGAHILGGTVVR